MEVRNINKATLVVGRAVYEKEKEGREEDGSREWEENLWKVMNLDRASWKFIPSGTHSLNRGGKLK